MNCEACGVETSAKFFSKVPGEKKTSRSWDFLRFLKNRNLRITSSPSQKSWSQIDLKNPNSELLVHFGGWKLILFHYEVGKRFLQFAIYNRYLEIPWTQDKNCHVLFIHYVQRTRPNSDRHPLRSKNLYKFEDFSEHSPHITFGSNPTPQLTYRSSVKVVLELFHVVMAYAA